MGTSASSKIGIRPEIENQFVANLGPLKVLILALFIVLMSSASGSAQACGFVHAVFYVSDSSGKFVDTAKLELLRADDGRSILHKDRELSVDKERGALEVHHGLCGPHYKTKLVISDAEHERFEATVDLPLNTNTTVHAFWIRLKKKGSSEVASIERWARLAIDVQDRLGGPIADASVWLIASGEKGLREKTSRYGEAYFVVPPGGYTLEVTSAAGRPIGKRQSIDLKPGPEMSVITVAPRATSKQTKKTKSN